MRRLSSVLLVVCCSAVWLCAYLSPVAAIEGEFWRGRTVTLIAPAAPGGGYDGYARLVARHIGKHIPGRPAVTVVNMPGDGGMAAANHVAKIAPTDGTVIALLDRSVPLAPLLHDERSKAAFDPLQLNWLGSLTRESAMGVVSTRAPAQTIEEAKTTVLLFGSVGIDNDAAVYVRLFNALFGTRIKLVSTFKSQPEIFLAIERGELHGLFVPTYSGNARTYIEDQVAKGQMAFLAQINLQNDPKLPDVPGILDHATTDQDRQVVELLLSRLLLGRPVIAPPNLPPERLAVLRKAFEKMLLDPEFVADAQQSGLPVQPIAASEAEDILRRLYQSSHGVVERARHLVGAR